MCFKGFYLAPEKQLKVPMYLNPRATAQALFERLSLAAVSSCVQRISKYCVPPPAHQWGHYMMVHIVMCEAPWHGWAL